MKTTNWFNDLLNQIESLSDDLDLDDFGRGKLRDFVIEHMKEQYSLGSKSGAAWAFNAQHNQF